MCEYTKDTRVVALRDVYKSNISIVLSRAHKSALLSNFQPDPEQCPVETTAADKTTSFCIELVLTYAVVE